jgi:DNA-binding beta-propeller fold protein YncE
VALDCEGETMMMTRRRKLMTAAALAIAIAALGIGQSKLQGATRRHADPVPTFEVDPLWPKPLPNHWVLGNVIGVGVDANDHVFIVHRNDTFDAQKEIGAVQQPPLSECCVPAPPVLEFDPAGNLVKAWGGKTTGYDWPESNHGISIDNKNNVWIGGNGTCPQGGTADCPAGGVDSFILKFTHDGKFLMEIGVPHQPVNSNATDHFGRVAKISFDVKANEAYLADGYGNKRVAVIDMDNGKIKRFWGAYGHVPSDSNLGPYNPEAPIAQQFRNPVHCAEPTPDGLVYVCDRVNDRIQVFKKNGEFVKEKIIKPQTRGDGSVWDIAFSRDPQQKYIYLADGKNERVYVMDRQSLEILTQFGEGGRQPGEWFAVHSIATDSKGNIYTAETYEGKRIQKFVAKGMKVVPEDQGVVWPKR